MSLDQKQRMSLDSTALNDSRGEVQMLVVAQVKNTGGATLPQMIVEEISRRKLTYYRDCLPAIQGLGTRIHKVLHRRVRVCWKALWQAFGRKICFSIGFGKDLMVRNGANIFRATGQVETRIIGRSVFSHGLGHRHQYMSKHA
jgi:hypothetical protein